MKRIAFVGMSGHSRYAYSGSIHQCDGMPRSSGSRLDNLLEAYDETDNKGNMIHGEAPARILKADRNGSCYISARALIDQFGWSCERTAEELSQRFDLVVFSMANAIRPNFDLGATWKIMDALRAEFIVLGLGIQNPLPYTTESLHRNVVEFLAVANRKAKVFGVRGLHTERWLKAVGFDRAKALGCPSMYVYPKNILGISSPDPTQVTSAITGGYINGRTRRSSAVIDLFKGFDVHYVMQDEIYYWKQQGLLDPDQDIYNDATGEVRRDLIDGLLENIHDERMPFSSYRWFQDPNAWRAFAAGFDFYLGDRLHGGIAALQAGVPGVLMALDARVTEVADFFGLPRIGLDEAETMTARDVVAEHLAPARIDAFKDTYSQRFREFEATLKAADIALAVQAVAREPSLSMLYPGRDPIRRRRRLVKQIRRLLRRL